MPLTFETLQRHELVGLDCEVVAASNRMHRYQRNCRLETTRC